MNGKHYIGDKAATFKSTGRTRGIDGVALVVDDGTEYKAGDQMGYVLELECPYGTQAMADALLEKLRGKSYEGFETTGAALPTGAELGDGVTVKGLYAPIVRRRVQFVGDLASDVSAPTGGDTDHEFGFTDPTQRQIQRAAARSRSYIDKKADEIKIGVEGDVDGKLSEITVDLEGITSRVQSTENGLSTVSGQLSLKVGRSENNQIVSMLNASANEINISGNRFVLDSDNFKVAADGTITATNGTFNGGITGGTIQIGDNFKVAADGSATMTGANMTNAHLISRSTYSQLDSEIIISDATITINKGAYTGIIDYNGILFHTNDGPPWSTVAQFDMNGVAFRDSVGETILNTAHMTSPEIVEGGMRLADKYQAKIGNGLNVGGNVELRTDDEGGNVTIWGPAGQHWEIDAFDGNLRFISFTPKTFVPFAVRPDGINVNEKPVQLTSLASGVEIVSANETQTVTFPTAFEAVPVVTASADGASVNVSNVTKTGFDVAVQGGEGVLSRVGWIAAEV